MTLSQQTELTGSQLETELEADAALGTAEDHSKLMRSAPRTYDCEKGGDSSGSSFQDYTTNTSDVKSHELNLEYPGLLVKFRPDDPRVPLNWSTAKKLGHTIGFALTTFTAQFGASLISPSTEQIAEQFHVGNEVTILVFSIYVLGNMVGPMIFAPISEVYGRKIGVFVPCFIAGIWLCVAANVHSVWALLVIRFIAGVFAAAPIVSSGGALGDLWRANQRAAALVLYAMCIISGSAAAPTFGALLTITGSYGWRWTCWLGGLLQMVVPVVNMCLLSESFLPVIEAHEARRLRLTTRVWGIHADIDAFKLTFSEFVTVHCKRPILMFFTPILFLMLNYASFVYGLLFLAIENSGHQFQTVHHFSFVASFLPLFAIFVGFFVGGSLNVLNSNRYSRLSKKLNGKVPAEERLPGMMLFGWMMPCGLFIYGWTMKEHIHWFVPVVGLALMGAGLAIIFQGTLVYIVDLYTKYAASAMAANTFMRSVYGGVFPLFTNQMFNGLGVHWASSLLAFVTLALWPCSWLFYIFGARIRAHDPFQKMLR